MGDGGHNLEGNKNKVNKCGKKKKGERKEGNIITNAESLLRLSKCHIL